MALVDGKVIVDLQVKGEQTGNLYQGKFVMRLFLSLKQRNEIAVEFSKRDFGNSKDQFQTTINQLVCELQARCEDSPPWFKGERVWELSDYTPIFELKKELDNALEEHMKSVEE
jgi:hypothetical protein